MQNEPFGDLVQQVIKELSLVYGSSVQRYSEPKIRQKMQFQFTRLFQRAFWPQFCSLGQFTLDGVNGFVTHDMSSIVKRWQDIQYVWPVESSKPLSLLPERVNPLVYKGTKMQHIMPINDPTRVFRVVPFTATGQVAVRYRTFPRVFTDTNDLVNFDSLALVYATVWDFLEDDGTNPNATAKYQGMVDDQLKTLMLELNHHELPLNPTDRRVEPTQWWTSPF